MKILTVIGARPQFVKAAIVSKALAKKDSIEEIIIHTGQHFDANMSDIFFEQLKIKQPHYTLNINGGTHGGMTGRMLIEIESILQINKPDAVMVYGDTNSTLAGALAASKMHIPVIHVEAGLRSFNMAMPEETNRILTDQVSSILFCPTDTALENLKNEGFNRPEKNVKIVKSGDVMLDIALLMQHKAVKPLGLPDNLADFIVVTCHRQENTDNPIKLENIIKGLNAVHHTIAPVVCPLHPRTAKYIAQNNLSVDFITIEPVGYLEMLWLLGHCALVITDSGGLQKEACFMKKYCLTLRDETEWVETVHSGINVLIGAHADAIIQNSKGYHGKSLSQRPTLYGDGNASEIIANSIIKLNG